MVVDATSGLVQLLPAPEAEARVAAAEAARAYDGLRDGQALEQWLALTEGSNRGAALLSELVPRAVAGAMPVDDLARVRRAAERSVPASAREAMRRAEAAAFMLAVRQARLHAEDCAADVADAEDADSLERIAGEARALAEGVASVSRLLGQPDLGAASAARRCRDAATRRAKSRAGKSSTFESASAAGGADRPEGVELPSNAWSNFVERNALGDWLARTLDDASLGLRRKSERIRDRMLAAKLDSSHPAGTAALAAASGAVLVSGEDAALKAEGPADVLLRVKEVWAASWTPGPLGARLRAGRGLAYDGRVRIEKVVPADVSGLVFSRDPGSGRRDRLFVETAKGSLDVILAGDIVTESYTLERLTGRQIGPTGAAAAVLSAENLARVARLARALDAWKGAGVEVAFSFSGGRLIAHHARTLDDPRPVLPLHHPFSPRPDAGYLNIRPVAR
ncbi:MAG: hypothetical protein COV48_05030 [Elusimicrobia bacterium CG11_big_fil_rev_8_21_14_0_20_64_6]|nr:MAG: hypothetical protein COV48_05030 [Elusimicrobia bacterium CG11_big_fil_rev_8_21_14_0_20_64_6]